jgi:hypothetical protein
MLQNGERGVNGHRTLQGEKKKHLKIKSKL